MKIIALFLSPAGALLFAPLFLGIIVRVKAFFAGRKGQPLLQVYYNLFKLFRKGRVVSRTTSWIFKSAPFIIFLLTLSAAFMIPLFRISLPTMFTGDVILLIYFLGLARFFLILAALDTGSAFEGMGASREAFYSALVEPVLFITLITVMKAAGTKSIAAALFSPALPDPIILIFSAVPLFIILLVESARIPFDDPGTHLELTMIHEVMILDNSGPDLALLEYAAAVKLWLFSLILAHIITPYGTLGTIPGAGIFVLVMIGIAVLIGIVESIKARVQLSKIPQILFGAGVVSFLGFFIIVTDVLTW